jgi:predicted ATP-grasp superfamily ATP-dependent carboligase
MVGEELQQDGFDRAAKWIRLTTDVPTAVGEILKGRLAVADYFNSFKGKTEFAVLSAADPLPFIAEILMIPYLWKKRGF